MKITETQVFIELVKAGLWETDVQLSMFGKINFDEILRLATEQGVVGLVSAGMERVIDLRIPQTNLLQFVGQTLQIEQRNKSMNQFVAELVEKMRAIGIYAILVKGQGVAQCYEKPLWRPSGDVDFLMSEMNYKKAKELLLSLSSSNKNEERYSQHLGMCIGQWYVEIHGSLRTGLSGRVDKEVDAVQRDVFYGGKVRSWMNGNSQVFLPALDEDVFFVFTHFIKHFYKEGMTLRQVCDWCRLIWVYRDTLDFRLLESRIRRAGLMKEWKAFAAVAVSCLGMPKDAMPFYDVRNKKDEVIGQKLIDFILEGNSGNKVKDTMLIAELFPCKALLYSPSIFLNVNWLKVKERMFGDGNR